MQIAIRNDSLSEYNWFVSEWNRDHAKPVKTKDGKGYMSYPYNMKGAIYSERWADDYGDFWYNYKSLPLTIHTNCWVEVRDTMRRAI